MVAIRLGETLVAPNGLKPGSPRVERLLHRDGCHQRQAVHRRLGSSSAPIGYAHNRESVHDRTAAGIPTARSTTHTACFATRGPSSSAAVAFKLHDYPNPVVCTAAIPQTAANGVSEASCQEPRLGFADY